MSTLTKMMFTLTKGVGHERHMVILIGYFDQSDHFDQILICTSSKKGQIYKMVHQDAHGLVKSAILIWVVNLLVMPTRLPTYLLT